MRGLIEAAELLRVLEWILISMLVILVFYLDKQRSWKHERLVDKSFIFIYIRLILSAVCLTIANYVSNPFTFMFFVIIGVFPIITLGKKLMKLLEEEEKKK